MPYLLHQNFVLFKQLKRTKNIGKQKRVLQFAQNNFTIEINVRVNFCLK